MRFLCTYNQRLPNAIFDFRKIPSEQLLSFRAYSDHKEDSPCYSTIYSDEWKAYDDLVNVGYKMQAYKMLYRVICMVRTFLLMGELLLVNEIENF